LATVYAGYAAFYGAQGDEAARKLYDEMSLSATPNSRRKTK
jgi:hypothetical protein